MCMIILPEVTNLFLAAEGCCEDWISVKIQRLLLFANKYQLEHMDKHHVSIEYVLKPTIFYGTEIELIYMEMCQIEGFQKME